MFRCQKEDAIKRKFKSRQLFLRASNIPMIILALPYSSTLSRQSLKCKDHLPMYIIIRWPQDSILIAQDDWDGICKKPFKQLGGIGITTWQPFTRVHHRIEGEKCKALRTVPCVVDQLNHLLQLVRAHLPQSTSTSSQNHPESSLLTGD